MPLPGAPRSQGPAQLGVLGLGEDPRGCSCHGQVPSCPLPALRSHRRRLLSPSCSGVGLAFLFSWLLVLLVFATFLVGGNIQTLVCRNWVNQEIYKVGGPHIRPWPRKSLLECAKTPPKALCPLAKPDWKSPILDQKIKFRISSSDLHHQLGIALRAVHSLPAGLLFPGDLWGSWGISGVLGGSLGCSADPRGARGIPGVLGAGSSVWWGWERDLGNGSHPRIHLRGQSTPRIAAGNLPRACFPSCLAQFIDTPGNLPPSMNLSRELNLRRDSNLSSAYR